MTSAIPGAVIDRVTPKASGLVRPRRDRAPAAWCRREHLGRGQHRADHQVVSGVNHQQARPTQLAKVDRSSLMP